MKARMMTDEERRLGRQMRWVVICVSGLLLTACNEVTGNESGGIIDGSPYPDTWDNHKLKEFGIQIMLPEDALKKATNHCALYRKRARITSIAWSQTLFECL